MKQWFSSAVLMFVMVQVNMAQSLEEGKKFMYYERYQSAKEAFSKLLAAKPGDAEAIYWLGQAYIGMDDVANARQTYQAAMVANPNAPLLQVGMGHVELVENKTAEARSRFENAISISKGKDIETFHAIGRANTNAKAGDYNYAVSKLQLATQIKNFKDASVYLTMGDAYRKLIDGGNAVLAYKNALSLNPTLAAARHREGLIYETQKNREYFLPAFEEAVSMDPNYGPALYSLYAYWYFRDVSRAEDFLNRYIAVIDSDPQNDYFRIDLKYASKKYDEAIRESEALIAKVGEAVVKPRIYRLKAYSYFALSDFSNARAQQEIFFNKTKPEDIVPRDFQLQGDIAANSPGREAEAYASYEKAMALDTTAENKLDYMQRAIDLSKKMKDKIAIAYWQEKAYWAKKTPNNVDMYNLGKTFFDAGDVDFSYYTRADSIFSVYTEKYPTQPYGWYWRGRTNWSIDTSMMMGKANPHFEKLIEVASTDKDSVSLRPLVKVAYKYFIGYEIFVKKDYPKAIEYCDRILAIDPNDKEAADYKSKLMPRQPATTPKGTANPNSTKPAGTKTS